MLTEFKIIDLKLSLDENFSMAVQHHTFPIESSPARIDRGITCICTRGQADIEIDFVKYHIEKRTIVWVFPAQVMELKYVSDDFQLMYIACSKEMLQHVLTRFPSEFGLFLQETPVFQAPEDIYREDITFWDIISNKYEDTNNICRNEIIINLLRAYYLNVYNCAYHKLLKDLVKHTRKMDIVKMFINLIMKHYKESREVAFYAEKLNITPKYLSIVTQEERAQSAKKVIDDFMITEIKLHLKSTAKSIQEISEELNFSDQAFFGKYFKRQTGLTPSQYRNK
ncbi:MAG: AraC family transcriptional regulator [Labilibaculum sp.]|nr:AraC family transcriptional regulator [Labilibaculum sp.]